MALPNHQHRMKTLLHFFLVENQTYKLKEDSLTISKQRVTPPMEPNYSKKYCTMDNLHLNHT